MLDGQKVSFQEFTDVILKDFLAKNGDNASFDALKPLITENFGLKFEGDAKADRQVLKDFEIAQLQDAFARTLAGKKEKSKDEAVYLLYGSYDPLTIAVTHILNQKAGLGWTTYSHTGVPVSTSAVGSGSEAFGGYYDNTDIFKKLAAALGLKTQPAMLAAK